MKALVFVEHTGGDADRGSLGVLSKVAGLGAEVAAVLCGSGVADVADTAAGFGASRVYVADDPRLAEPFSQPRVEVLARLVEAEGYDTVLFSSSPLACDMAGGLADRLTAGLNWDLVDLELADGRPVGLRLALQDSVLLRVAWRGEPRVGIFRPGGLMPIPREGRAEVEPVEVAVADWSARLELVERTEEESGGRSVADADIVVAGGRGLGGPDGFRLLEELADALEGAVGASLPTVEIGWYPYSALVGQSGSVVSPKLYIACGISGALQHRLGMQSAGAIIAVNSDPQAAIFDVCDLGVVADLYEVVPRLIELVRERRSA